MKSQLSADERSGRPTAMSERLVETSPRVTIGHAAAETAIALTRSRRLIASPKAEGQGIPEPYLACGVWQVECLGPLEAPARVRQARFSSARQQLGR